MKMILHVLTRREDAQAWAMIREQQRDPDLRVEVADLTGLEPDYAGLLEHIFAADSIQVW